MRERAELIGGTLSIVRRENGGTVVRLHASACNPL
jgi:signal transduction histidine kinase